jgi:hypothetical protein
VVAKEILCWVLENQLVPSARALGKSVAVSYYAVRTNFQNVMDEAGDCLLTDEQLADDREEAGSDEGEGDSELEEEPPTEDEGREEPVEDEDASENDGQVRTGKGRAARCRATKPPGLGERAGAE